MLDEAQNAAATPSKVANQNTVDVELQPDERNGQSSEWQKGVNGLSIEVTGLTLVLKPKNSKPKKDGKPEQPKVILDNIDLNIAPGKLLAIMGPSGSGKSSLLNALAGRTGAQKNLELIGSMKVNGKPINWKQYKRDCAYVQQDDNMFSNLTVFETLLLAAKFRLRRGMSLEERKEYVNDIISDLGLNKARDTIIGDERVRGISGGERKRVNIGVEIIASPSAVLLDEPTSGLDSWQSLKVMETIKRLASGGRTIVASIHQPRSSITNMVDDLILLSEGNVIYNGKMSYCLTYFEENGYICPAHFNPADFFIDLVSLDNQEEDKSRQRVAKLIKEFEVSDQRQLALDNRSFAATTSKSLAHMSAETKDVSSPVQKGKYNASFGMQFKELFLRSLKQKFRDKPALLIPAFSNVFFAVILGLIYLDAGYSQLAIQDRTGALFFVLLNQFFGGMFGVINTFPVERSIVVRERASKSYSASAYFLAKFLADVPLNVFFPTLFSVILYFMIGLNQQAFDNGEGIGRFFTFVGLLIVVYFTASAFGLLISSLAGNVQAASAMGPPFVILFVLFGGFYANRAKIPAFVAWLEWVSPIRYGFAGAIRNEFEGVVFECEQGEVCIRTGEQMIQRLSLQDDSVERSVGVLLALCLIYNLITYLLLRYKAPKHLKPQDKPQSYVSEFRRLANQVVLPSK